MNELERVLDAEIVEDRPSMEDIKSEWTTGASQKLMGQLRQARAAAMLRTHYGAGSVEGFAKEMNVAASTVYEYARTWRRLLESFGAEDEIYGRLENSPLTISNVIESGREEDVARALNEAEDDSLSSRAQRERRRQSGEPKNVETITRMSCPHCGAVSAMKDVETWTEAI